MTDVAAREQLKDQALEMRRRLLRLANKAGSLHIGGDLSMTDIMTVIFEYLLRVDPTAPDWPERDRFVLSKGHGAGAMYVAMANRGFFDIDQIYETYGQFGTRFGMHPCRNHLPGVEASTGSLGHGLSLAVGMALAARIDKEPHRVVTVLGDAELNEGSIWEAVMAASHYQLGNLVAFIDHNNLSMDGRLDDIMKVAPISDKFAAFGWDARDVPGNDVDALIDAVDQLPASAADAPVAIVAHTTKGRGVSLMENQVAWHAGSIDDDTLRECIAEVERARDQERRQIQCQP